MNLFDWTESVRRCMSCKTGRTKRNTFMYFRTTGLDAWYVCPVCDVI